MFHVGLTFSIFVHSGSSQYISVSQYNLKSQEHSKPALRIQNPINVWQKSRTESTNSCENIATHGRWKNWKQHNFNRYVKINGTNITITNAIDKRYPITSELKAHNLDYLPRSGQLNYWYPFLPWKYQNFSGNWISDENCKTDHLTEHQLKKCFDHGRSGIMVIGDSVSRQMLKALELYVRNETCCFYDSKHRMKLHFTAENITRGNFKYITNFRTQVNEIKNKMLDDNKLILFGPSVLHLLVQDGFNNMMNKHSDSIDLLDRYFENYVLNIKQHLIEQLLTKLRVYPDLYRL